MTLRIFPLRCAMALTVACGLLTGCKDKPAPPPQAAPAHAHARQPEAAKPAPGSTDSAGQSTPQQASQGLGGSAASTPAGDSSSGNDATPVGNGEAPPAGDSSGAKGSAGEEQLAPPKLTDWQKDQVKDLERIRPKHEVKRRGIEVRIEFTGADYNSSEKAKLSNLHFSLENTSTREKALYDVTDKQRDGAGKLDLGWCTVKVRPQLAGPQSQRIGGGMLLDYRWVGRYIVELYDAGSKPIGFVLVDENDNIFAGDMKAGYSLRTHRDMELHEIEELTVNRLDKDGNKLAEVLRLRFSGSGYDNYEVSDALGNRYGYRFPAGKIELVPPEPSV